MVVFRQNRTRREIQEILTLSNNTRTKLQIKYIDTCIIINKMNKYFQKKKKNRKLHYGRNQSKSTL